MEVKISFVKAQIPDTSIADCAIQSVPSASWELHQLWAQLRENSLLSKADRDKNLYKQALEIIDKYCDATQGGSPNPIIFRKPRGGRRWWDQATPEERSKFRERISQSRRGKSSRDSGKRSRTAEMNWWKKSPWEREKIRQKMKESQRKRRERERSFNLDLINEDSVFSWI